MISVNHIDIKSWYQKRFAHRGGCYFGSATKKAEDGEFSLMLLWRLGERAKFIVIMVFVAGELHNIHGQYRPKELQHYMSVSCMQISNITSKLHEKYTCETCLYNNKPSIKYKSINFSICQNWPVGPLLHKSVSKWNQFFEKLTPSCILLF